LPNAFNMAVEGRTPAAVGRLSSDPEQKVNRDADRTVNRIANNPRMLWGWAPGEGCSGSPLSHDEFEALMLLRIDLGASFRSSRRLATE
jgi:hypothetical protein